MHKLDVVLAAFALALAFPAHAGFHDAEAMREPIMISLVFFGLAALIGLARRRRATVRTDAA